MLSIEYLQGYLVFFYNNYSWRKMRDGSNTQLNSIYYSYVMKNRCTKIILKLNNNLKVIGLNKSEQLVYLISFTQNFLNKAFIDQKLSLIII